MVIILLNHSAWYRSEWLHLVFSSWSRAGELIEVPILGMSHITGGGIPGNLPRCLPKGMTVDVDYDD